MRRLGTDEVFGPEAERLAQGPEAWLEVREVWEHVIDESEGTGLPAMLRLARWQTQLPELIQDARSRYLEVLAIDANNIVALHGLISLTTDEPRAQAHWLFRLWETTTGRDAQRETIQRWSRVMLNDLQQPSEVIKRIEPELGQSKYLRPF